ncbi:MAG: 4-hydroxy-3-methylbut-2-enyl diphosphate reductase, partial [Oscillospiraceae bacterium]|nr:4-hydroxy-3-methylbut-2-enyl diphosphate reductase [Oscillospiraceae bacterium]
MTVTVAEKAGFCFGVSRAVDEVYKLALDKSNGRIYTVGSLIHNKHIVAELEERGVKVISEKDFEDLASTATESDPCTVVIRTHGVRKEVSDKLACLNDSNPFFKVCDLTCPYVKKIHRIVSEHSDEPLVVFGDKDHPEVQGIVSYSNSDVTVVGSAEEVFSDKIADKSVIAVAQTTQSTEKWKKTQKNLKKVCTNANIFDTICRVTEDRQSEAAALASVCDLMLVIGGRNSSNTNKLYETSKKVQLNTFFIENKEELDLIQFTPFSKVGITAGASTPGGIIQEVLKHMSELENKNTVAEDTSAGENFAEMLEESLKTLNTGETVTGVITSVSAGELHVDLGAKVTGIIAYD